MALDGQNLLTLAKTLAHAKPSSQVAYSFGEDKLSYNDLNETFRNELNEIAGTYELYRENHNTLFTLLEETFNDILPVKVMEQYGMFAEIRTYAHGDKPVFTQKITEASRARAKKFVSKVGVAGRYEVFKLDGKEYEVTTSAYGAACQIAFEDFLSGRVDFAELLNIALEGVDEKIYLEISKALDAIVSSIASKQPANYYSHNKFVESEMDYLLSIADAYGSGKATIYCTFEFAATMLPADGRWSDAMREAVWANGYLGNYKGHQVVVLRQSFEDTDNTTKVINPARAIILPGGAEKPVKVAIEGGMHMKEVESQDDWSRDLQFYQRMGVAATMFNNNICVYENTSLTKTHTKNYPTA